MRRQSPRRLRNPQEEKDPVSNGPGVTGWGRAIACRVGTASNIHLFSGKNVSLCVLVGTVQEETGCSQETTVRSRAQEILSFI